MMKTKNRIVFISEKLSFYFFNLFLNPQTFVPQIPEFLANPQTFVPQITIFWRSNPQTFVPQSISTNKVSNFTPSITYLKGQNFRQDTTSADKIFG